jgi:acyl transferase domain-containing protein/thioesterase domain-containing protein/acyl carrier protein
MTIGNFKSKRAGDIAIVGLSVCVPGSASATEYWDNLRDGVESIRHLGEEALLQAGERADLIGQKNYVSAAAVLDGYDMFDADFFGFSPKEAAILDPQHRKFLESAWEAMESAGHPPESVAGNVGVFAGCGMGSYFYFNVCSNPALVADVGMFLLRHTGNDKDFLSTRVSHVFDLKGPSINLQTACSTSLVAVHYAAKALRDGECDMALAGGVTIELPQGRGYLFKENEILSPDGHCHAFDHRAEGTVFGSGAGTVVLRRLADAIADGDHIWAVIKGSAVNNDGAAKAGYLAPSVDGQAAAVAMALKAAEVGAETIDYVECHGTGTYLGDPIEVSALTEAYHRSTDARGYCRIGSVKTNIGHLDTAAGVAGLIKTSLALHHRQIPPSLGYEAPNPAIDFDTSPFRVNDTLRDWTSHRGPRRAGVNALGVGGTNAHVVLEEAPDRGASDESDFPFHVLCLSGRNRAALDANTKALAAHLRANPDLSLADVAYTLKQGRRGFDKRRVLVAETATQAADLLEAGDPRRVFTHERLGQDPEVVFMFPGGGAQYTGMARDLYETEPVFADWMDRGLAHLQPRLGYDIRALWLPQPSDRDAAETALKKPSVQLPLIMIVEYALAQLWLSWGVRPAALVGHSMGENTAACLAGVMSFEDCIDLVLLRGQLFDTVPSGGMLSVALPMKDLRAIMADDLDIAGVNAPGLTAVSGPQAALEWLAARLKAQDIDHQRIAIDIAAHSRMLEPILGKYRDFLRGLTLSAPRIPLISNSTGMALSADQATDPDYWVQHLRGTVLFADCIATLAGSNRRVFLEVGPGKALSSLAQMNPSVAPDQVLATLRHPDQDVADDAYFIGVIGRLWATGVDADWAQIWGAARRHRLPLPTYAFQRSRYFIEPGKQLQETALAALLRDDDIENWGYRPAWRPRFADCDLDVQADLADAPAQNWLIFQDDEGIAARVCARLEQAGHSVVRVTAGDSCARLSDNHFVLPPELGRDAYDRLIGDLAAEARLPTRIGHFWLVTGDETCRPGSSFHDRNMERGFFSLTWLSQALASADMPEPVHISIITSGAAQVRNEPLPYPEKATIAGPAGVIPHEVPGLTCATLDIELAPPENPGGPITRLRNRHRRTAADDTAKNTADEMTSHLLEELLARPANTVAAWRGPRRLEQVYRPVTLSKAGDSPVYRDGGTYMITGGFGGIGQSVAADLLQTHAANVVLVSRQALPPESDWPAYLHRHSPTDKLARRIRAMQQLQAMGGTVTVAVADVCNIERMREVRDAAEARFGAMTGVIHAAGSIGDGPVLTKTAAAIEQVFAPKITGLRVLDALFPDGTLELMVLFSSSSTATKPAGQIDYVAANEYLNAFAKSRQGGDTQVSAINWGVWSGVGMAAEAMARRQGGAPPSARTAANVPMLDQAGFDPRGNRIFLASYRARDHWVLDQHRTRDGTALLPGTGFVELAAEALEAQGITGPFRISDLYFFRPLQVDDATAKAVVVRLEPTADGYEFTVHSGLNAPGDPDAPDNPGYQMNAQARLTLLAPATDVAPLDLGEIASRCRAVATATADARLKSPQEAHLRFGPRWHVLDRTALGAGEGLARLTLPKALRGDLRAGYILHPGLLDLATGWAMDLVEGYDASNLWVPVSYRSIRVYSALPADFNSWVRLCNGATPIDGFVAFDVTLCDAGGQVIAEIEGFQMQRTTQALDFSGPDTPDADAASLGLVAASPAAPLSPEEQRLHYNISRGIRPGEGAGALRRALALKAPQLVVSSLDLPGLIGQADHVAALPEAGQSFDRPDLDSAYVAPTTGIEKTLAGLWESLLGVSQVGIEDGFFDLGGHSLIAVRLFAQINREYDLQLPISVLFETPTIAKCAAMIARRIGADGTAQVGAAEQTGQPFTHLVALDPGNDSTASPFFLVAGMFGNVLNLRHIALQLGQDRPVYGLQARGLIGEDEPHRSMPAAAADYIAEMRRVQPQGPYLLGGYSGGGVTAYEIAQQLQAAGETVSVLAMLDTPIPVRPVLNSRDKILIKLREIRTRGVAYLGEWARSRLLWELQRRKLPDRQTPDAASEFNNLKIETAFRQALIAYDPKPWRGPLVLLRPPLDRHWKVSGGNWVSRQREYVFDDNAWSGWAPNLQVVEVPGDHDSMVLAPNVSVLAARLQEIINRADPNARPLSTQPPDWLGVTAAE